MKTASSDIDAFIQGFGSVYDVIPIAVIPEEHNIRRIAPATDYVKAAWENTGMLLTNVMKEYEEKSAC